MAGKLTGAEVRVPVDGTVTDWENEVQVNPETGQRFDFDGRLIVVDEAPVEEKPKSKKGKG